MLLIKKDMQNKLAVKKRAFFLNRARLKLIGTKQEGGQGRLKNLFF